MPPTSRNPGNDKAKTARDERAAQPVAAEPAPAPPIMAPDVILGIDPEAVDYAYTDAAAKFAAAARETAEKIGELLADLRDKYDGVQRKTPGFDEASVAAGVQRLPMAVSDVERALEGLTMAGAELASRAVR